MFSLTTSQKQSLIWVGLWLLFFIILYFLGPILAPFIAGAILAYVLNPIVDRLCRLHIGKHSMPRTVAVVIVIFSLILILVLLFSIVWPIFQREVPLLLEKFPSVMQRVNRSLKPIWDSLGITVDVDFASAKETIKGFFSEGKFSIQSILSSAKLGGNTLLSWGLTLGFLPIVLFYLLIDWRYFIRMILSAVPRRWVRKVIAMGHDVDDILAQYLRGQFAVMFVLVVYYSTALAIADFDVALPIGFITGFLVFIPYVGFGIGLVLAVISALLQFSGYQGLLYVFIIYGFGQVLEGFFLTPKLVGGRIGLHPLMVIFALLAFGQLFGFVGVLLALPISAILSVGFKYLRESYVKSDFYNSPS